MDEDEAIIFDETPNGRVFFVSSDDDETPITSDIYAIDTDQDDCVTEHMPTNGVEADCTELGPLTPMQSPPLPSTPSTITQTPRPSDIGTLATTGTISFRHHRTDRPAAE